MTFLKEIYVDDDYKKLEALVDFNFTFNGVLYEISKGEVSPQFSKSVSVDLDSKVWVGYKVNLNNCYLKDSYISDFAVLTNCNVENSLISGGCSLENSTIINSQVFDLKNKNSKLTIKNTHITSYARNIVFSFDVDLNYPDKYVFVDESLDSLNGNQVIRLEVSDKETYDADYKGVYEVLLSNSTEINIPDNGLRDLNVFLDVVSKHDNHINVFDFKEVDGVIVYKNTFYDCYMSESSSVSGNSFVKGSILINTVISDTSAINCKLKNCKFVESKLHNVTAISNSIQISKNVVMQNIHWDNIPELTDCRILNKTKETQHIDFSDVFYGCSLNGLEFENFKSEDILVEKIDTGREEELFNDGKLYPVYKGLLIINSPIKPFKDTPDGIFLIDTGETITTYKRGSISDEFVEMLNQRVGKKHIRVVLELLNDFENKFKCFLDAKSTKYVKLLEDDFKVDSLGRKLYRLQAVSDFPNGDVKKGELGGYILESIFVNEYSEIWVDESSQINIDVILGEKVTLLNSVIGAVSEKENKHKDKPFISNSVFINSIINNVTGRITNSIIEKSKIGTVLALHKAVLGDVVIQENVFLNNTSVFRSEPVKNLFVENEDNISNAKSVTLSYGYTTKTIVQKYIANGETKYVCYPLPEYYSSIDILRGLKKLPIKNINLSTLPENLQETISSILN